MEIPVAEKMRGGRQATLAARCAQRYTALAKPQELRESTTWDGHIIGCGSPDLRGEDTMTMRSFARCLLGAVLAFAFAPTVAAQAWPTKSIRLVVNFAAGGSTDVIARSMAQKLGETLGQTVIVDNRVGAAGNIGLELAAKSAPDGYTLLHSSDGPILINPHIFKMTVDVA